MKIRYNGMNEKSFENVFITVGADKCYKESKIGEKKTIFTETFVNKSTQITKRPITLNVACHKTSHRVKNVPFQRN